ncbi:MAG TPA: hypothetical protein VGO03_15920 [Acidimicrobiia bacterium]|jgi:hypothetical protein
MAPKKAHDSTESVVRQAVHVATGDRDAEAKALADRAGGDTDEDDALEAVRRTHGDVAGGTPSGEHEASETATADDVRAVQREQSD